MKFYVIFDALHERVCEVHSDENRAYQRCEELDKKHGNDYVYPHRAIPFKIDKQYQDFEEGEEE